MSIPVFDWISRLVERVKGCLRDQTSTARDQRPDFSLPEDLLKREALVTNLNKMLFGDAEQKDGRALEETVAICGGWGTGKTWFVQTWCEHLEQNNLARVVYLSAWKNDYGDDPIVSLLQQIQKDLDVDKCTVNRIRTWIKKQSAYLLPTGRVVAGLLLDGGWREVALAVFNSIRKRKKNEDQKREKALKELKQLLRDIAEPAPLIVFVDELDRCRPLHAIAMLERIKHIFQDSGITFVLSIDKTNLKKSIQSVYGQIDADDYLRRFFEIEYHLPQIPSTRFVTSLFSKEELHASDVVPTLLLASDLSLRSIQRVATGNKLATEGGLLSDALVVGPHGTFSTTAKNLYDGFYDTNRRASNENETRSNIQEAYADGSYKESFDLHDMSEIESHARDHFGRLFCYQDSAQNRSLSIQDFAWGIVASSIMLRYGARGAI